MEIAQIYKTIPRDISKKSLINELVTFFSDNPQATSLIGSCILNDTHIGRIDNIKLIELIGYLHQKNKEDQKISETNERKHFGIYYTPYSIARQLAKETLDELEYEDLLEKTFFEPCAGIGIFIAAYIDEMIENKKMNDQHKIQKIIDNIYYADIDSEAIALLKTILPLYIKQRHGIKVVFKDKNSYIGDILFNSKNGVMIKNNPIDIFKQKKKFDFVLTNPPYRLLKANSNKYRNDGACDHHKEIGKLLEFIRRNKVYKFNEGTLNYYKIFVEEIVENYTDDGARVGLLIPITILNDKQSFLLRKRIFSDYGVKKIYTIPENNTFFQDISQAFCFFVLNKNKSTGHIDIINDVASSQDFSKTGYVLDLDTIRNTSETYPIIVTDPDGIKIFKKISNIAKLGSLGILNLRGELDLTLHKNFISDRKTNFPLLRGEDIGDYAIKGHGLFVMPAFVETLSSKIAHINSARIVGQQISNIHGRKRLKFALIEGGCILGNSCNYLLLAQNLFGNNQLSLKYLLGILNSKLLDWRFRITNSNNHISNYEIAELPIVTTTNLEIKNNIESIVDELMANKNRDAENKLNDMVFDLYDITDSEKIYINNIYAS